MKQVIKTIQDIANNPALAVEAAKGHGSRVYNSMINFAVFVRILITEFTRNHCTNRASGIAFVLLITLIPLIATAAIFFTGVTDVSPEHLERVITAFLPFVPPAVMEYITEFFINAQKLRGIGVGILIILAVSLFGIIEQALNSIWRVMRSRSFFHRLRTFTMMIVYSPLLFFVSHQFRRSGIFGLLPQDVFLMRLPPIILATLAFAVMFKFIPNTQTRMPSALIGGALSCLLFELVRWGFGYYVDFSIQTHTIYGAFGLIVFFLMSLYFTALLFLLGAQAAYVHQNFRPLLRSAQRRDRRVGDYRGYIAMRMMIDCVRAFIKQSAPPTLQYFCDTYDLTTPQASGLLNWLIYEKLIHETGNGKAKQYIPARDFSADSVSEMFSAIEDQNRRIPAYPSDYTKEYLAEFMSEYGRRKVENDLTLGALVKLLDGEDSG
ncbi:MAG: YihY/virulence factor BrkB family protein [Chitinispirillales bacterium]|jgi:membrane protein|nr:YihY/virulence factor BrkB family protein [Chitinispirillales bacterium]